MKRFVITGIGRSATKYTSDLLTAAGLQTSWEKTFKVNRRDPRDAGVAESSWLAAPFLTELPEGTVVLHQIRDPLKWLQSWMRSTVRWPGQHLQFINEHSRIFRWDRMSRPQADMLVWVRWHRMIEAQVETGKFPYLRYRVEDLDQGKVLEIANLIGATLDHDQLAKALKHVSRRTNTSTGPRLPGRARRAEAPQAEPALPLTWAELPAGPELDAFKQLAETYGYGVTDE